VDPTDFRPTAHGAFTVTAAGSTDLTRRQAASSRFVSPSRGVRYPVDVLDPRRALWESALLTSRPDAVLTGPTAALHWDLPLPPWLGLDDSLATTVATPAGSARPVRRGVRGRRILLPEEHVTQHLGLAVTTAARTWLDCAAEIPAEHVIVMGDAILRRGLASQNDLESIAHWAFRRRGVRSVRRALPWLDDRSESPGESLARAHLVLNGVPRPCCNRNISSCGQWLARVDMCWPEAWVIVEYDGVVHLEEAQRRRDAQRRNRLQAAGWLVITFTADDLRSPSLMATQVMKALAIRAPR